MPFDPFQPPAGPPGGRDEGSPAGRTPPWMPPPAESPPASAADPSAGLVFTGKTISPQRVVRPADLSGPRAAARHPPHHASRAAARDEPESEFPDVLTMGWFQRKLREQIERSPPFSVSLCVHVIALIALALWVVSMPARNKPVIEISFSEFTEEVHEEKGVEIAPTPEPPEEPQPEQVETEKPPVEDPVAAPPQPEQVVEAIGPSTSESTAPTIGSLLDGREEGRRDALVRAYGGSDETEAAVARALAWLVKQQDRKTGLWSLHGPYADGSSAENQVAATAMALIALQGAGNTPRTGKHRAAVARGWKGLLASQQPDGHFEAGPMPSRQGLYSHAQATVALCELHGMTREKKYLAPAQRAVEYAVSSQGPNGGWRYEPGKDGDMSVTGWFMMALKSGEMAGVPVPPATMEGLSRFLDQMAVENGARYGYRKENPDNPAGPVTDAVSAEGLLCRQYLGWKRDDERLIAGVESLLESSEIEFEREPNAYAWYYMTQVVHHLGGTAWDRWNDRMKEALPEAQEKKGEEAGSWEPSLDRWGGFGGRLYMTCFCTYMLEVYYRHLPLYEAVPHEAVPAE